MERLKQSGLMAITLTSPYTAVSCTIRQTPYSADLQSASWIHQIRQLWLTSGKANVSHATISTRRILVIVLDVTVAVLGTVSFVLCVRSIVRGFLMWRVSCCSPANPRGHGCLAEKLFSVLSVVGFSDKLSVALLFFCAHIHFVSELPPTNSSRWDFRINFQKSRAILWSRMVDIMMCAIESVLVNCLLLPGITSTRWESMTGVPAHTALYLFWSGARLFQIAQIDE